MGDSDHRYFGGSILVVNPPNPSLPACSMLADPLPRPFGFLKWRCVYINEPRFALLQVCFPPGTIAGLQGPGEDVSV